MYAVGRDVTESRRAADEQAALRRVATLVARGEPPSVLFAAVAEEVGRVLPGLDMTSVARYDGDHGIEFLGAWTRGGAAGLVGERVRLGGHNVATLVREHNRPTRVEYLHDDSSPLTSLIRPLARSAAGAPINVEGRLWGVLSVGSLRPEGLPPGIEDHLASFVELLATAIANAQAREELTASRARIVATADQTRRKIERDIHDGVQQRLVSLVLELRPLPATLPPGQEALAAELEHLATGLTSAIDELRELTRGIHPAILTKGGLARALRTLTRRSPVPVELGLRIPDRLPDAVEIAAYYIVSEAHTNAVKHAGASSLAVDVDATDSALSVSVRDDGVGGADFSGGSGLVGLKDRVEALGGRIQIESPSGGGTTLSVTLPLDSASASPR